MLGGYPSLLGYTKTLHINLLETKPLPARVASSDPSRVRKGGGHLCDSRRL
jgi:hypothetical protein